MIKLFILLLKKLNMFGGNPENRAETRGTREVNQMIDMEEGLAEKIGPWQNAVKEVGSNTQKTANINSWYRVSHSTYGSSELKPSMKDKALMERVGKDPNYIFKSIVDTVVRSLLFKYYRSLEGMENVKIKVLNASDYDNIKSGINCIVSLGEGNSEEILGIDLAVTDNLDSLGRKAEGNTTSCKEYNLYKGLSSDTQMKRQVLHLDPQVISSLVYQYLSAVENGERVDVLELYTDILNQDEVTLEEISSSQGGVANSVESIIRLH